MLGHLQFYILWNNSVPRQPSSRGNLSTSPPAAGKCWKSSLEVQGFNLLSTLFCSLIAIPSFNTPALSIKDFKREGLREARTSSTEDRGQEPGLLQKWPFSPVVSLFLTFFLSFYVVSDYWARVNSSRATESLLLDASECSQEGCGWAGSMGTLCSCFLCGLTSTKWGRFSSPLGWKHI